MPTPPDADRIPARTDEEAQDRFLRFLRRSLTAINRQAVWLVSPPLKPGGLHSAFTVPDVLRLKTNDPDTSWYLWSTMQFTFGEHPDYEGDRKVFTENYAHTLSKHPSTRPEFCSWQWDPTSGQDAHVHVGRGDPAYGSLGRLHIPTARVTFEQIARFAICDLGALPNRDLGDTDDARKEKALELLDENNICVFPQDLSGEAGANAGGCAAW